MVSYISTPSSPRHVSFMPIPVYSRQCHDDELYVLNAFEKHASHCHYCIDPLRSHLSGSTLCTKGHARAIDVAQYVYGKEGLAYSLVDRRAHQRVRLEVPAGLRSVQSLLAAWEQDMKLLQPVKREKDHSTSVATRHRSDRVKPARINTSMRQPASHHRTGSASSSDYERGYNYTDAFTTSPSSYYYPEASYSPSRSASAAYRVTPGTPGSRRVSYYPR